MKQAQAKDEENDVLLDHGKASLSTEDACRCVIPLSHDACANEVRYLLTGT